MIQPMPNRGTNPTEFVCFISGFVFVVFDFKAIKKSVNWVGLSYLPPPFSDIWSKALFYFFILSFEGCSNKKKKNCWVGT